MGKKVGRKYREVNGWIKENDYLKNWKNSLTEQKELENNRGERVKSQGGEQTIVSMLAL